MYKGSNDLELNEATMIEAVQRWLHYLHLHGRAPKVVGVKSAGGSVSERFLVSLNGSVESDAG